jgi:hypothetical protein
VRRIRRFPSCALALALCALTLVAASPAAAGDSDRVTLAVVGIDRIGPDRLEAIKTNPAVAWWVEVDREMLVAGSRKALERAFAGRDGFRVLEGTVRPDELYFTKQYGPSDFARVGARLIVTDGTAAVIEATREQVALLAHVHDGNAGGDGCRGHSAVVPFEPNAQLAHQAVNGRIPAAKLDASIQGLVDQVDGQRWSADNQQLATFNRYTRGSGIAAARQWAIDQFEAMPGLEVTTQQFTVPNNVTAYNVIAKLPGTTRPDDWYIVGAHLDSISNNDNHATAPGAEDNGSGSAAVLELARIFTANPPEATMYFILFTGEEQGLYGSEAHAASIQAAGNALKVKGMFNMDMIAYTGDADLDCLIETKAVGFPLRDALVASAAQYTSLRIVTSTNPCCSDHMPYINRNMPGVLSIENDYSSYPGYHRSSDLASGLTIQMAVEIMKMNVGAIAGMVGTAPAGLGDETIGIFDATSSTFFLRDANGSGNATTAFIFGTANAGWEPLAGDWNGDGSDTIGLYDPASGTFFLNNANGPGSASLTFPFGAPNAGLVPLVGDWNGDGTDTIGVYNPATATFFLRNSNTPGAADVVVVYGGPNMTPVVGDWDGDGAATVGVVDTTTATWFLRNSNTPGNADITFVYGLGNSGMVPVVGDWNNDRSQTAGLYDPATGTWFLRNSNSSGPGAVTFIYGAPNMTPLRGDWNNQ